MDKTKSTLYLDLDDVCADWMGAAQKFLSLKWDRGGAFIPDSEWQKLIQHSRFYLDLPLMPGAVELVLWATKFARENNMNLAFLTAIPRGNDVPYVFQDKIRWVDRHFPDIPVFFGPYSTDKHLHCKPGDILIDDRPENCADWVAAGGIAHIYTTWEKCKEWAESNLELAID